MAYANTFGVMLFLIYAARYRPDWIQPTPVPSLRTAGAFLWLGGAVLSLWPLWYLRRNFSVEPEARDLVTSGPYRWARHPIYAVYLLINAGILLRHLTLPLAAVLAGWLALLLVRGAATRSGCWRRPSPVLATTVTAWARSGRAWLAPPRATGQ